MSLANSTDKADSLLPKGCEDDSDNDKDDNDDDEDFDQDQLSVDLSALLPPSPAPLSQRPSARTVAEAAGRRERAGRFAPPSSGDGCPAQPSGQLYAPPLAATFRRGIVALASNCAPAAATSAAASKVKVVKQRVAGDGGGGGLRKSWLPPPLASPPSLAAVVPRQPPRRVQAFAASSRLGGSARRSYCLASRIGAGSSYGTRFSRAARALTQRGAADAAAAGSASLLAESDVAGTAKTLHLR